MKAFVSGLALAWLWQASSFAAVQDDGSLGAVAAHAE